MQAASWFRSLYASRIGAPLGYFGATWILVSVVRVHVPGGARARGRGGRDGEAGTVGA